MKVNSKMNKNIDRDEMCYPEMEEINRVVITYKECAAGRKNGLPHGSLPRITP